MKQIRASSCWLLILLALLLSSCQGFPPAPVNSPPPPTCEELAQQEGSSENLPFETIARDSVPTQFWPETEAGLFVITEPQDLGQVTPHVNEKAIANLQMADFGVSLVVGAFSNMSNGGWQFCITSITQHENEINIHAHFIEPPMGLASTESYYHLLRLLRKELPHGEVIFNLALTRHKYAYIGPTQSQAVLEKSPEEIVASVIRTIR